MDPTANLPFNLSLSDKEKEARSQVILPYTYNKERFVIFFGLQDMCTYNHMRRVSKTPYSFSLYYGRQ